VYQAATRKFEAAEGWGTWGAAKEQSCQRGI